MKLIIGIDDTDNRYSRGTGYRAREMSSLLSLAGLAEIHDISRHQLLFDSRIPFTSHNSSASIVCEALSEAENIYRFCRKYLWRKSALFSDAGLCVAEWEQVNDEIINWGHQAKTIILSRKQALEIAGKNKIYLRGLRGRRIGVIGALAAVGLRKESCDGRLLWMKNMRELNGVFTTEELYNLLKIDKIALKNGSSLATRQKVFVNNWCRAVHVNGKITLFVEEENENEQYQWRIASKEFIKSISE